VSDSIRIVLVATSHPGNIGAAARALKNMALDELVLVRPRLFPHPEASARASGANDVLESARVETDLRCALRGCGFVLATTSRERDQYFRVLDVRAAVERLVAESAQQPVAVVFGPERTGLSNEELNCAHALLRIPANPAYPSLNLAMAVQIVSYEILRARSVALGTYEPRAAPLAEPEELERLYLHLATVLEQIDFRDRTERGTHLMNRIRRFVQRAEPDANEVNILRGILTAVQQRRRRAGEGV
jgi:TrmH family RNA methyltransferase